MMTRAIQTVSAGFFLATGRRSSRRYGLTVALFTVFFILVAQPLASQQITRVAVLDLSRVLAAFPKDTMALKNFETKKAEVQAEVDKRAAEIRALQVKKSDAEANNDSDLARSIESDLARKTADLKQYASARQNELDLLAKALSAGASFLQSLGATIAQVAESEGYSLVLNLKPQDQNANIVLWNSASIDITDKVIQALSAIR